jgi:hypothetical protein
MKDFEKLNKELKEINNIIEARYQAQRKAKKNRFLEDVDYNDGWKINELYRRKTNILINLNQEKLRNFGK